MTRSAFITSRWLPRVAALAAAFVGLVNIVSALTPNIRWRGHLLLGFEPVEAMRLFHALALPAGAALLLVAPYLLKRRRRGLAGGARADAGARLFDLLKGLDFEETALTWGVAAVLTLGRPAFTVRHDPITLRSALWRVPLLGLGGLAVAAVATWASQGHPSLALGAAPRPGICCAGSPARSTSGTPSTSSTTPTPGSRWACTRSRSGRCSASPT